MRLLMIAVAVAVLALGVVAVGGVVADEDDGPLGSFLARVAEKLGVTEDELKTAIDEARDETIDEAVAEGRLTEEWGERLKGRADERGFPFPLPPGGLRLHGHGDVMAAAAEVLDMSQAELMEQIRDGNSLAEVAEAQGMDVEDFKTALLDRIQAQLDEQADEIFQNIKDNIDDIVSTEGCLHGFGGMRHGLGGSGGMWFGPGGSGGMFWFGPGGPGGMWFSPSPDDGAETNETSDVTA